MARLKEEFDDSKRHLTMLTSEIAESSFDFLNFEIFTFAFAYEFYECF